MDELLSLAKSKDTEQRASAARALGKSRAPEAFQPLLAMLQKDKDVGVQRTAAEALGLLGDRKAIPHLAKYLESGVYNLNWFAAGALAKLGGPEATKLLWKYATIPDADERFDYIGREASDRLADMYRARAKQQAGEALNFEYDASPDVDDSVVKVEALTGSKDDRLCARGLKLLELGTDVETVAGALSRSSAEVLEQALRTLRDMVSRVGDDTFRKRALKAVAPHAAAMSKLSDAALRCLWVDALGETRGDLAVQLALAATRDADPGVRAQAARVLGQLGPDAAVDALGALLEDKTNNVRHAAANTLGSCRKQKARAKALLTAFVKTAKGSAKSVAQRSLEDLQRG
jgi:HEAT repeat protein